MIPVINAGDRDRVAKMYFDKEKEKCKEKEKEPEKSKENIPLDINGWPSIPFGD